MQAPETRTATPTIGRAFASIISALNPWRSLSDRDKATVTAGAPLVPANGAPKKTLDVHALIHEAAERHQIPEAIVKSVVAAESNFNPDAVSPRGAIGLMQLMPATASAYGADATIPEQNVDAGTRHLRSLMTKYRKSSSPLPLVIAAYNAGSAAVDRYRGVPPFRETRKYVVRVLGFLRKFQTEHM